MWAWRSVSSFLNGRNEELDKADSVFCPTAQGQIRFFLPSFPVCAPHPFVRQPSSSVICCKPQRKLEGIKIHFFPALCLSFFFFRHWNTLMCGRWTVHIPRTRRYQKEKIPKKQPNTNKEGQERVFTNIFNSDCSTWLMESPRCKLWLCNSPNKVICHHPEDWPDRQTAINRVQRPKRSILSFHMLC